MKLEPGGTLRVRSFSGRVTITATDGRDVVVDALRRAPRSRLDRITLVPGRANGQPALAAYAEDPGDGVRRPYGVMVFACEGDRIVGITGFPQPELFDRLGLPMVAPS